jgi:hypothetical protein
MKYVTYTGKSKAVFAKVAQALSCPAVDWIYILAID